ncbi:hypothetical protein K439DRAFT_1512258 [Ramaria rubella]|nr:hypothetical protein K439DRAFT_1512258 [Ramaria rubella]
MGGNGGHLEVNGGGAAQMGMAVRMWWVAVGDGGGGASVGVGVGGEEGGGCGCACGGGGGWGCVDGHGGWAWQWMRWVAGGTVVEDGGGGASVGCGVCSGGGAGGVVTSAECGGGWWWVVVAARPLAGDWGKRWPRQCSLVTGIYFPCPDGPAEDPLWWPHEGSRWLTVSRRHLQDAHDISRAREHVGKA